MGRRGFTLIELLVVIAVIALLVSILLPSLSRAREQARMVRCESNARMLAIAVHLYAHDNNGYFPGWGLGHGGGDARARLSWLRTMGREYAENRDLLRCPADRSPHWTTPIGGRVRQTSYATNYYLSASGVDSPLYQREGHSFDRLDRIGRPAGTIFFAELAERATRDFPDSAGFPVADHVHPEDWDFYWPQDRRRAAAQVMILRHAGRAVYGFVDGHAEPLVYERTFLPEGDPSAAPGGRPRFLYNKYDPTVAR